MQVDEISPITHHHPKTEQHQHQTISDSNRSTLKVPKRHKTLKSANKLYKSPQDIYKINNKSVNCHFQYSINEYQQQQQAVQNKNKRKPKSKSQTSKLFDYSLQAEVPKLWGCIVPSHKETFIRKVLSNEFEKSQSLSKQYTKKSTLNKKSTSYIPQVPLENSSEFLLRNYMMRKFHSQEKEPKMQKSQEKIVAYNPEPKLSSPSLQYSYNCDCEKVQLIARELAEKKEKERWMRKETEFMRRLKKFQQKHYANQKKYESVGTTLPTRNIEGEYTEGDDDLGFFFTNQDNNKNKRRRGVLLGTDGFSLKEEWQRLQNYNNDERGGQYHQPETSTENKIKKLTELIKWRGKILQKIDDRTRQIKDHRFWKS